MSIAACEPGIYAGPYVSNAVIYAPLTGSNAAVAYLDLTNPGARAIVIQKVSSPQFARVEMHETKVTDGIARMRKINNVVIAAEATQEFAAGGKHVMLLQPTVGLGVGSTVTLSFAFDNGGPIIVETELQARPVR